jgi:release factor glutamine methyltransferase
MLPPNATLQQTASYLTRELGKVYPRGEAASIKSLILEHFNYPSSTLLLQPTLRPSPEILAQINEIVAEIHTDKPIQYILGYSYFCDLRIRVDQRVLIPRPETEEMVAQIIASETGPVPSRILDLGTGSGCIALALKKQFPEAEVYATDVSSDALEVASGNGALLNLQVLWTQEDLTQPDAWRVQGSFDLVVSNPPYVREGERALMHNNVLGFEPASALFVQDSDPLLYYRAIASLGRERLTSGGVLWAEINENLGKETGQLFRNEGYPKVAIIKDIHGKDRFIRALR